jgi:hypothetical protein
MGPGIAKNTGNQGLTLQSEADILPDRIRCESGSWYEDHILQALVCGMDLLGDRLSFHSLSAPYVRSGREH